MDNRSVARVRRGLRRAAACSFVVLAATLPAGVSAWAYNPGVAVTSPTVDPMGTQVFVGADDTTVRALDAVSGTVNWHFAAQDSITGAPAFLPLGPPNTNDVGPSGSPVQPGYVYAASADTYLYCLNATTGALIWSKAMESAAAFGPAVDVPLTLVFGNDVMGGLYAFDALTGLASWRNNADAPPAFNEDGTVVFAPWQEQTLQALEATSVETIWQAFPDNLYGNIFTPGVGKDSVAIVIQNQLVTFDSRTGQQRASMPLVGGAQPGFTTRPAHAPNANVFAVATTKSVVGLDEYANGIDLTPKWTTTLTANVSSADDTCVSAVAFTWAGTDYVTVGDNDGSVLLLDASSGASVSTSQVLSAAGAITSPISVSTPRYGQFGPMGYLRVGSDTIANIVYDTLPPPPPGPSPPPPAPTPTQSPPPSSPPSPQGGITRRVCPTVGCSSGSAGECETQQFVAGQCYSDSPNQGRRGQGSSIVGHNRQRSLGDLAATSSSGSSFTMRCIPSQSNSNVNALVVTTYNGTDCSPFSVLSNAEYTVGQCYSDSALRVSMEVESCPSN